MIRLVTRTQSRELDRIAIQERGIPGTDLMDRAGQALAARALTLVPDTELPIGILSGKGNNGGDGFAAALHIWSEGKTVRVFSTIPEEEIAGDGLYFFQQCRQRSIPIDFVTTPAEMPSCALWIDALLGTGFRGELRPHVRRWTEFLNHQEAPVLAADIPTGVDAESGTAAAGAVRATATVTMGYLKTGMVLEPGRTCCGPVEVADIGFPDLWE
ncbi:MAG: NAD(P)H-hydrate epimerase, partial [Candidatus Neomarinimicrobiota bacterium]